MDTATADAVVGVARGGQILREAAVEPDSEGRPRHSRVLLGEVERCAEAAGGWAEVDRIAVGIGPGSYTGLRIGIATARALAQARRLPLAGVGSLAALAHGIAEHPEAGGRPLLPVIDARRGQVFAALYKTGRSSPDETGGSSRSPLASAERPRILDCEELWEPLVADPAELAERLTELEASPLAAGDGAVRFRPEFEAAGVTVAPSEAPVHGISARDVCALGESTAEAPPDRIEPVYLRPPDAKRWLQRDRRWPGG
ncbi:MAG: tRNA (adenosine(37)-N6)-threonylcarbamoyltransferase complex dimerization subunit type 1 TsaB [Solirubrobacterales bacterium]